MDRLIAPNSVNSSNADAAPVTGTPQFATSGSPGGLPPTVFPAYAFNAIQEELIAIILAGGLTRDRTNNAQVLAAIRVLMASAQGNLVNYKPINDANYEIVQADMGGYVVLTGATASRTFSLDNAAQPGDSIYVSNISSGFVLRFQIVTGSSALFFGQPNSILGGVTFLNMQPGDEMLCVWTGFNWHVQYYSGDFMHKSANLSDVANLATALGNLTFGSANGVIKLPNFQNLATPITMQWGSGTLPNSGTSTSSQSITFNQAFPNLISFVGGMPLSVAGGPSIIPAFGATAKSLTGATFRGDLSTGSYGTIVPYNWFAIGG